MHIKSNVLSNFGDFTLDVDAVQLHSQSDEYIKLPYTGVLPQKMSSASSAYIYINVTITHGVKVVLVSNMKNGKKMKLPLQSNDEELISLLDKFFDRPIQETGLDLYNCGLWRAHYIDWRCFVKDPDRLLAPFLLSQ